tara:strand:+ start:445 stop:1269 length:825 start_codon:yes stop_codon:yes gene_type:complete
MGSIVGSIFGGGSRSAPPPPASSGNQFTQTVIREAPGIEERKIELMDLARSAADKPVSIPAIQVAPLGALEQQGVNLAGQTGTGIAQLLAAQTPNINQFMNPFQSAVVDEINRQAAIAQNTLGARAVMSGAFGGGREGVAQAELERARLGQVGLAQQRGFQDAVQAAQTQQRTLGDLGLALQRQQQADIAQLQQAGGLQRQLAQATLDAARQSQLQQAFEPFQRAEFLSNIYAAGPKSQSTITAATSPQTSPLAQSIGTGIGAFQAFQGLQGGR